MLYQGRACLISSTEKPTRRFIIENKTTCMFFAFAGFLVFVILPVLCVFLRIRFCIVRLGVLKYNHQEQTKSTSDARLSSLFTNALGPCKEIQGNFCRPCRLISLQISTLWNQLCPPCWSRLPTGMCFARETEKKSITVSLGFMLTAGLLPLQAYAWMFLRRFLNVFCRLWSLNLHIMLLAVLRRFGNYAKIMLVSANYAPYHRATIKIMLQLVFVKDR